MRLITRKQIWRAYPQLDPYTDEVCKRYMKHAFHSRNLLKGIVVHVVAVLVAVAIASVSVWLFSYEVTSFSESQRGTIPILFGLSVVGLWLTSVLWLPAVFLFVTRDLWLRHVVQQQIQSTNCSGCGYQLLGLTIEDENELKSVTCPECGMKFELDTGHLKQGDIDLKLLKCS